MAQPSAVRSKRRIAVIGGGISGLGCMWGLRHEDHEVHLYESDSRLGGHANTVMFEGCGRCVPVDTGFIAMNEDTYPEFTAFLRALNVETIPTDMSFSVSEDNGKFEWASTSLSAFVGTVSNVFSPWFWRLLFDIIRFNCFATDILSQSQDLSIWDSHKSSSYDESLDSNTHNKDGKLESIGEYLDRHRYSEQFKNYFIIPMVAAPWCIDPAAFCHSFPATTLIRFMDNHGLLNTVTQRLLWRTIKNGSKTYIEAFLRTTPQNHHIYLHSPIKSCVRQKNEKVNLEAEDGSVEIFDHVVFAVHANDALKILGEGATTMEQDILRHFDTSENICVVHSDMSLMPRRPSARASWNCLMQSTRESLKISHEQGQGLKSHVDVQSVTGKSTHPQKISVTFDMNRLQGIPVPGEPGSPGRVLVSMNPIHPPSQVQGTYCYKHPLFSSASVLASKRLHLINGVASVSFAGAWMGHGFHEDGFAAGLKAARNILKPVEQCSHSIVCDTETEEQVPRLHLRDMVSRGAMQLVQLLVDWTSSGPSPWQPSSNLKWLWVGVLMMAAVATVEGVR